MDEGETRRTRQILKAAKRTELRPFPSCGMGEIGECAVCCRTVKMGDSCVSLKRKLHNVMFFHWHAGYAQLFRHTHTHRERGEEPRALSHDTQQLKTEIYGVMLANTNRRLQKKNRAVSASL